MWESFFQLCQERRGDESHQIYGHLWPFLKLTSSRDRTHLAVYSCVMSSFSSIEKSKWAKNTLKQPFEMTAQIDTISRSELKLQLKMIALKFSTQNRPHSKDLPLHLTHTHKSGSRWMYKWWALVYVVCINQSWLFVFLRHRIRRIFLDLRLFTKLYLVANYLLKFQKANDIRTKSKNPFFSAVTQCVAIDMLKSKVTWNFVGVIVVTSLDGWFHA